MVMAKPGFDGGQRLSQNPKPLTSLSHCFGTAVDKKVLIDLLTQFDPRAWLNSQQLAVNILGVDAPNGVSFGFL